jgi:hypothetical protein
VVACGFVDNASVSAHVVVVAPCSVSTLAVAFKVVKAKGRHPFIKFGDDVTEAFFEFGEAVVGHGDTDPGKGVLLFKLLNGFVDGCLEDRGFANAEVDGVVCILGLQFSLGGLL